MLLKDVKQDEVYFVYRYGRPSKPHREGFSHVDLRPAWDKLSRQGFPGRALEVGVHPPGYWYKRPGVLIQQLDPHTLEPATDHLGEVIKPEGFLAVSLLMPWREFHAAYHDYIDEEEERVERRRVEHEREKAEARERYAREWMESVFVEARRDMEQVAEVMAGLRVVTSDKNIKALVDLRFPDGNPYLNGSR